MAGDIEARIVALARRQHGVVTREQLLEAGLGRGAIGRRVRSGRLRRLYRGVYLLGAVVPPLAREMAAVLAIGPTAVLSHWSAAYLWKLLPPPKRPPHVDVTVVLGHNRKRAGIRVWHVRRMEDSERITRKGIPVTTSGRTLVDLAVVADGRDLERAVARAQREHLVEGDELSALLARHRGRPGTPRLRSLLAMEGGAALTDSEAEDRFLALVQAARLPRPESNATVAGYRVDFVWRAQRLAVEIDGYRYHSSRPHFESDRRKAAYLAAHGIQVVRLSWSQVVEDGVATAVQVGQALALAQRV